MPQEAISVLDGSTFVVSDRRGDLLGGATLPPHGFFHRDTRFVSGWRLRVQGARTDVLSTSQSDYFAAEFFLVVPVEDFHAAPAIGIVRQRLVGPAWREDVVVVNHVDEPVTVAVDVEVETDFADIFEVKEGEVRPRPIRARAGDDELVLAYEGPSVVRETHVAVSEPATVEAGALRLTFSLAPREERRIAFDVTAHEVPARRPQSPPPAVDLRERRHARARELDEWLVQAPELGGADDLRRTYVQSLTDLAALRFYPDGGVPGAGLPAAGLPWFMTLFGRDSLLCSYQTLPYLPELARTTLRTLAGFQGTVDDPFRDQEPGKILHEVRYGELTRSGEYPHSPYYGSADATPLFLVVLDEYIRWSGDLGFARELEPHARAALEWIDAAGDLDGDGYVEYRTRNPDHGLVNQCWKDSWNSILFADGAIATGPVAASEIQGYVYDAKRRAARLARAAWDDDALADRLEAEAETLRERFLADFWLPRRRCFALALDGGKRVVDSLCSNMGHLLWSGIVDDERAEAVAEHLLDAPLWSGWGVRTMAATEGGYNPVEYHNGAVWPHDNSLIAAGLRRYGHAHAAARIAEALLQAAPFFDHRLPEVFSGCRRDLTHAPVAYPTASSPQAWAAGAPLLLLTSVLGLEPGPDGLRSDPCVSAAFGEVSLAGVPGPWGRVDVLAAAPAAAT